MTRLLLSSLSLSFSFSLCLSLFPFVTELYKEYRSRPMLPGPLVIISDAWTFILAASKIYKRPASTPQSSAEADRIAAFQQLHTDRYVVRVSE